MNIEITTTEPPTLIVEASSMQPLQPEPESLRERIEDRVQDTLQRAEHRVRETAQRWKEQIRAKPGQAVMIAAAGGYVAHRLSSRGLFYTALKILAAFTPPTLVALGLCKAAEYCKIRDNQWSRALENSDDPSRESSSFEGDESPRVVVTDVS